MALLDMVAKTGYNRAFVRPLTAGDRAYLAFTRLNPGEFQDLGALLFLDGPPLELADLRAHVTERLRHPRARMLTERLETVTVRSHSRRSPRHETHWVADPDMNIDDHVVALDLPPADHGSNPGLDGGAGDARLRAAVDHIAAQPTDITRPPWTLYLLRDPDSPATMLVYRCSHVQQDGVGLYQSLHLLFGGAGPLDLGLPPTIRRPRPTDYVHFVATGIRCLTPTRILDAWGGPPTGPARHSWVTTELGTLRAIARRHDVTINDVYLAALAGALRTWSLPEWHRNSRPIHMMMPVSIRANTERDILSNYTSGVRVALPCGEPDPARRLAHIATQTRRLKQGGLGVIEYHHFPAMAAKATPRMLAHAASYSGRTREMALVATNGRTLPGPLTVVGRPVTGLVGIGPLLVGRQHLSVAMFGHDDRVSVMIAASASVPGHTRLAELWQTELAILARLAPRAGVTVPTQRRRELTTPTPPHTTATATHTAGDRTRTWWQRVGASASLGRITAADLRERFR